MDTSWLSFLRCPFCSAELRAGTSLSTCSYGILSCHCSQFPVIESIPILKKDALTAAILTLVQRGEHAAALMKALLPTGTVLAPSWAGAFGSGRTGRLARKVLHNAAIPKWRAQAFSLLTSSNEHTTACQLLKHYWFNSRRANYYFFAFRYGQARYLAALSFTTLISKPAKPILDLGCGCGHLTATLVNRAERQPVYGLDGFFFCLFVAKQWLAPEAHFVCASADGPLPFRDSSVSAIYASEVLQYVQQKALCFREATRVVEPGGIILMTMLTNALVPRPGMGDPLSPEGYDCLAGDTPHRLVPFSDTFTRYCARRGPALRHPYEVRLLEREKLLSLVVSDNASVFQDYDRFRSWPHGEGKLQISPLYEAVSQLKADGCLLRMRVPTSEFESEHPECLSYMPAQVLVTSQTLIDLNEGRRTPGVQQLVDQFVAYAVPPRYFWNEGIDRYLNTIDARHRGALRDRSWHCDGTSAQC